MEQNKQPNQSNQNSSCFLEILQLFWFFSNDVIYDIILNIYNIDSKIFLTLFPCKVIRSKMKKFKKSFINKNIIRCKKYLDMPGIYARK